MKITFQHISKTLIVLVLAIFSCNNSYSQIKRYSYTSWEFIFHWADVKFSDSYINDHPGAEAVSSPLRFSAFINVGQYYHIDFNNNFGIITGAAVRNVGFISNERLDLNNDIINPNIQDLKIIRRTYTLGIPLAFKLGSFKDHLYFFGGAEAELAFAYQEKYWNSHSRSGSKTRNTQWFGGQTKTIIPSVYGGVQMPGGLNLKFKYYLTNFLNPNYTSKNLISDLSRYEQTQVMYVAVSWQFETKKAIKKGKNQSDDIKMASYQ